MALPQADRSIDLSGLPCPLPILRTKKALAEMPTHSVLHVIATDAGSPDDFMTFCRQTGHILLATYTEDDKFNFLLQHK